MSELSFSLNSLLYIKGHVGAGAIVRSVRYVPIQTQGLEFRSPAPLEKLGTLYVYNASPGEGETGGSLGLAAQPVQPNQLTPGSVKDCIKTQGRGHTHVHTSTCEPGHTCAQHTLTHMLPTQGSLSDTTGTGPLTCRRVQNQAHV